MLNYVLPGVCLAISLISGFRGDWQGVAGGLTLLALCLGLRWLLKRYPPDDGQNWP